MVQSHEKEIQLVSPSLVTKLAQSQDIFEMQLDMRQQYSEGETDENDSLKNYVSTESMNK